MNHAAHVQDAVDRSTDDLRKIPATFLNAYKILNPSSLSWAVNVYGVDLKGDEPQGHDKRGRIKDIIWKLRSQHASLCRGQGFVTDISPRLVAVSAGWNLPVPIDTSEYSVSLERSGTAKAREKPDSAIVEGILREAVRNHFKKNESEELGPLWQDYKAFCEYPRTSGCDYLMCRRFTCEAKLLRGGIWVLRIAVNTATVDGRTFEDYYLSGRVGLLAEMLEAKRRDRVNRKNRPISLRVLRQYRAGSSEVKALELEDFDVVLEHARLPAQTQQTLAVSELKCKQFNKPSIGVPMGEMRLILDTQLTLEEHAETIIEPGEREELMDRVRSFVNGVSAFGQTLELSPQPIDADAFEGVFILPPAVQVRDSNGSAALMAAPTETTDKALEARALERASFVRRNGFLVRRPINPALAWPARMGKERGARMGRDLEYLCSKQGIKVNFGLLTYNSVEEIRRKLDGAGNDTLLAVLPESSTSCSRGDDTHERLKRTIEVPSQCIHHDNTLPEEWADKPWRELRKAQPRLAGRVQNKYELCVANLLVKHHWFPFAPASPFHYNVHVGLDVGGVHNTDAMACMGYGFRRPLDLLLFLPEEIPIDVQKAEPIPTSYLYRGLLTLFEAVWEKLSDSGLTPDFETALFYRDGALLGDGDAWNEREALKKLHAEFVRRKWASENAIWTAVEVMKGAEGWRLLRNAGRVTNPLVGRCLFPFEDERTALVCTTGAPYLTQGTARPLKVHIVDISGQAKRDAVLSDLVWESDMCFSKPDMGMGLPWVLHVADTGALQKSRSYQITGITA
jgi:hypothetical protein